MLNVFRILPNTHCTCQPLALKSCKPCRWSLPSGLPQPHLSRLIVSYHSGEVGVQRNQPHLSKDCARGAVQTRRPAPRLWVQTKSTSGPCLSLPCPHEPHYRSTLDNRNTIQFAAYGTEAATPLSRTKSEGGGGCCRQDAGT